MGHNNSNMRKKEIVARDARGCSGRIGSRPIWPKVNRGTEVEVIMPAICSKNLRKLILSSKNLHDICLQCAPGTSFETFFLLVERLLCKLIAWSPRELYRWWHCLLFLVSVQNLDHMVGVYTWICDFGQLEILTKWFQDLSGQSPLVKIYWNNGCEQ